MSKTQPKAVFILGMHRSGTSALARTLNLLGLNLGDNFYQGPVNPRGYWEHAELMALNDEILSHLIGFWTSSDPLPGGWTEDKEVIVRRDKIREILLRDFSTSPLWGFKDPRLCVLLPLYLPILDEMGCDPLFVHGIRNPVDVALSLQKRDQTQTDFSLVLWLRYTLEAFYHSYPYTCAFVSYETLLQDWRSALKSASDQLQITWPRSFEEAQNEIDAFLEPTLRSFDSSKEELDGSGEIFCWISETYKLLQALCKQEIRGRDAKALFEVLSQLNAAFQEN